MHKKRAMQRLKKLLQQLLDASYLNKNREVKQMVER